MRGLIAGTTVWWSGDRVLVDADAAEEAQMAPSAAQLTIAMNDAEKVRAALPFSRAAGVVLRVLHWCSGR